MIMRFANMFKTSMVIFCGIILLAACSKEEPATVEETPAAAAEDSIEAAVEEIPGEEEPAAEEALEVVEESDAVEADDDADEAIVLAQADTTPSPAIDWKFTEGEHYVRMVPSQPTFGGADKIEVAEFFWYGCGHCYDFEPTINSWETTKPADVRFVRIPAMWNDPMRIHAQLYYTEEVLVRNGKIADPAGFRSAVFEEFHRRNNQLLTEASITSLFERFGVDADDFQKTWGSFEVAQSMRKAQDLARRYSIAGVPAVVVNGKYRTGGAEAGSYPRLIEVIDELVLREGSR